MLGLLQRLWHMYPGTVLLQRFATTSIYTLGFSQNPWQKRSLIENIGLRRVYFALFLYQEP